MHLNPLQTRGTHINTQFKKVIFPGVFHDKRLLNFLKHIHCQSADLEALSTHTLVAMVTTWLYASVCRYQCPVMVNVGQIHTPAA